jgi:hypothetical protein
VECPICLKEFTQDDMDLWQAPCAESHVFHSKCLVEWVIPTSGGGLSAKGHDTCPICRAKLFPKKEPPSRDEELGQEMQEVTAATPSISDNRSRLPAGPPFGQVHEVLEELSESASQSRHSNSSLTSESEIENPELSSPIRRTTTAENMARFQQDEP